MLAEYKLFHGAVLSELIDIAEDDISIGELKEEGRLSSYILNGCIGVQIKHSTARLPPWYFTVTKANAIELSELARVYRSVFVVLVCNLDGMVTLAIEDFAKLVEAGDSDQAWLRVDRSKRQWYSVSGNAATSAIKKSRGVSAILTALKESQDDTENT